MSPPLALPLALVLATFLSSSVQAQIPGRKVLLPGENPQVRNRLQAIDNQARYWADPHTAVRLIGQAAPCFPMRPLANLALENGALEKWEQLLDAYQQLVNEAGDALVPLRPSRPADSIPPASVQLRRLCHLRLAALPPSILKVYRQRVDVQARKFLQEGQEQRSAAPLRRLVDELFCSRSGDLALDLLGELAFEKGHFEEALAWWSLLVLPPTEATGPRSERLVFPDPQVDMAGVRAKQILALAFGGNLIQARQEWQAFQLLHRGAEGSFAGLNGSYARILEIWFDRLSERLSAGNLEPWTTFAGNAARNQIPPVCPPARLWIDGPTWRVRLPRITPPKEEDFEAPRPRSGGQINFHPVVAGDLVLINDAHSVLAYHLRTGKEIFHFELKTAGLRAPLSAFTPESRFTLSIWNQRVYARLGQQFFGPKKNGDKADGAPSYLVCLDGSNRQPGKLHWHLQAQTPDGKPAFFEGTPLVEDGRVYVAVSRLVNHRTQTALACHDAWTGKLRWWQEVCDTPEFEDQTEARGRQHLVTLAAGQLFYCAHAGAVVCVDAGTGQRLWSLRYPSRGAHTAVGAPSPRELTPASYGAGRIYLAPLDTDHVFCVDAFTGRLLWDHDGLEVVHLLGVSRDRLVFSTPGGVQALGAADGSDQAGWRQPSVGKLPSRGRGLLAGAWFLWPTQDEKLPYRGLTLDGGLQERFVPEKSAEPEFFEPTMLRALLPGNMAFGQGCLAIAGAEELAVYVPQKEFLKEREKNLKGTQATPLTLYQLAMAQADAGLVKEADVSLRKLLEQASDKKANWHKLAQARKMHLQEPPPGPQSFQTFPPQKPTEVSPQPASASLPLPLERMWEKSGGRFLPWHEAPSAHLILEKKQGWLHALDLVSGKTRWKRLHSHEPYWAAVYGEIVVAAGPESIQAMRLKDGELLWVFGEDFSRLALVDGVPVMKKGEESLSGFQSNSRFLFCLFDERLLLALDPATGKPAWVSWVPGGEIRPLADGGSFLPHYHAGARFVLLQTSAAMCRVVDSATGKLVQEFPCAGPPWPQAPLALDESRFVLAEEAGRLRAIDAVTGKTVWVHEPNNPTSLTGAPAHFLGNRDVLLALIPRNLGPDLVRLDAATGTVLWTVPFLPGFFDLASAALDRKAVYFACHNHLQARALTDGRQLWQCPLPGRFPVWHSLRSASCLLAYPSEGLQLPWVQLNPCPLTWPLVYQLSAPLRKERAILVLDPKDGQWIQRLPLAAAAGPVAVQLLAGHLLAETGGKLVGFRSDFKVEK